MFCIDERDPTRLPPYLCQSVWRDATSFLIVFVYILPTKRVRDAGQGVQYSILMTGCSEEIADMHHEMVRRLDLAQIR